MTNSEFIDVTPFDVILFQTFLNIIIKLTKRTLALGRKRRHMLLLSFQSKNVLPLARNTSSQIINIKIIPNSTQT